MLQVNRCILWCSGELPHIYWGSDIRVSQDAGFVRDMEEVFVSRPGLGSYLLNRDWLFRSIGKESLTAEKTGVEFWTIRCVRIN